MNKKEIKETLKSIDDYKNEENLTKKEIESLHIKEAQKRLEAYKKGLLKTISYEELFEKFN